MGMDGEMPNDFKWHFGGVVLRDLVEGWNRYAIYGSFWVDLPDNDPTGSRVFPPFQGAAGGPSGGPLLTVKGQPVDLFIEPTGVKPGAILELSDTFAFAGQVAPPLASRVDVVVTSPGGVVRQLHGRANKIGYFYDPAADFSVDQAGVWTVDVTVTHDGMTSAGPVDPPYPTGGVLGTQSGRYQFYVVDPAQPRATVNWPAPGWVQMYRDWDVTTTPISVPVPQGWTDAVLRYTIAMPGWVLQTGELAPTGGTFLINYDPKTLRNTFPNIDLRRPQGWSPGLSDEVFINFVVSGNDGGSTVHRANAVTLHGEQILFEGYAQPQIPPTPTPIPEGRHSGPQSAVSGQQSFLTADCLVEAAEVQALAGLWRQGDAGDQDGDGDSDVLDVMLVAARWGQDRCARPPWCRDGMGSNCAPPAPQETLLEDLDVDPHQDVGRVR
jgi:hypothetical protein